MTRMIVALLLLCWPVLASAQQGFQSPSGNIHCAEWGEELRCDIRNHSYRPPRPREVCEQDYGGALALGPRGAAQVVCAGDTISNPGHPVLRYGTAWQGKGVTCASSEAGVRCTNAAGRGFSLSRARLDLF